MSTGAGMAELETGRISSNIGSRPLGTLVRNRHHSWRCKSSVVPGVIATTDSGGANIVVGHSNMQSSLVATRHGDVGTKEIFGFGDHDWSWFGGWAQVQ